MYELNAQTFRQLLEGTSEDTAENDFEDVVPYLMEKVCSPVLHGQPLVPSRIDYSRFAIDDLYDLLDAAQGHYCRRSRLWELNRHLCSQTISQSLRRAFC